MDRFAHLAQLGTRRIVGLNSGTSADGVDSLLVEVRGDGWSSRLRAVRFRTVRFPPALSRSLSSLLEETSSGRSARDLAARLAALDLELGRTMGKAARGLRLWAERSGLRCHLVGSHGQTVWHGPCVAGGGSATLQLGHAATIALTSGLPVVADFRQADVAAGGQGAPLTPAFDYLLYGRAARDTVCLNLGGVANLSAVRGRGRPEDVSGFDVGPCNLLLDGLYRRLRRAGYDAGGKLAARGHPSEGVVESFLREPFFREIPPRTTGREAFGGSFVTRFLRAARRGRASDADVLATATLFVARAVARSVSEFILGKYDPGRVVASGGGVHNRALMAGLKTELGKTGVRVEAFREAGLTPDSKEAALFAWLAGEAVCGRKAHLAHVTGAREARVLGSFHL